MLANRVRLNRRRIAPLLGEGEQALACIQLNFQLRSGRSDWLEGAVPPREPTPPSRADTALRTGSWILELASGSPTAMEPKPGVPEVRSAFDVIAAGPAGSYAYRLVHAVRRLKLFKNTPYCLITNQRLIFVTTQKSHVFEALVDVPPREVAAVARRKDVLLIEFTDASFVRVAAVDTLAAREARKMAELLAPGAEREPDLVRYAPPWARMA